MAYRVEVHNGQTRNEYSERFNDAIKRTADSFLAFGRACSKALASISPLLLKAMQEQWEFERGPTIGRKRRARRARGRQIEAKRARGPGLLTVAQWAAAHRTMQGQLLASFLDPSMGEPWEEQADG
jgi:hypothetical protein